MEEEGAHKKADEENQESVALKPEILTPEQEAEEKEARTTLLIGAAVILFFGLFALITWLSLRPVHAPKYYMDNVQITRFAVSNASSTGTLDARFVFTVTAKNENRKMDFKYDWITVDASYGGQNFGRGSIAGFTVGKRRNDTRSTGFNVTSVALPAATVTSLNGAIRNGTVPLRVYAKAKIHVKIVKYVSFPVNVDVDCRLVVVPNSATATVTSKVCRLIRPPYKKARKFKVYRH